MNSPALVISKCFSSIGADLAFQGLGIDLSKQHINKKNANFSTDPKSMAIGKGRGASGDEEKHDEEPRTILGDVIWSFDVLKDGSKQQGRYESKEARSTSPSSLNQQTFPKVSQ